MILFAFKFLFLMPTFVVINVGKCVVIEYRDGNMLTPENGHIMKKVIRLFFINLYALFLSQLVIIKMADDKVEKLVAVNLKWKLILKDIQCYTYITRPCN